MKEAINESGIVIQIINVARQRPKKRNTTITTNNRAYITVSAKLSIVFRMLSEVSTITPSFTSLGRFFCKRGRASSTFTGDFYRIGSPDCFLNYNHCPLHTIIVSLLRTFFYCVNNSCHITQKYIGSIVRTDYDIRQLPGIVKFLLPHGVHTSHYRYRSYHPEYSCFSAPIIELIVSMLRLYASSLLGSQYT